MYKSWIDLNTADINTLETVRQYSYMYFDLFLHTVKPALTVNMNYLSPAVIVQFKTLPT